MFRLWHPKCCLCKQLTRFGDYDAVYKCCLCRVLTSFQDAQKCCLVSERCVYLHTGRSKRFWESKAGKDTLPPPSVFVLEHFLSDFCDSCASPRFLSVEGGEWDARRYKSVDPESITIALRCDGAVRFSRLWTGSSRVSDVWWVSFRASVALRRDALTLFTDDSSGNASCQTRCLYCVNRLIISFFFSV